MEPESPLLYTLSYPWLPADDHHPVACYFCKGSGETHEAAHFLLNGERYAVIECLKDDLMYLSPQPGSRYLKALYSYPTYYEGSDDMYGMTVDDEKSRTIAAIRIKEALAHHPAQGAFLELGCAYGHTLEAARAAGFNPVTGIEYSKDAVARCQAKGLDVRKDSPDEDIARVVSDASFSVIALYSVLEHLSDPARFLERVRPLLDTEGIMIVRVPDTPPDGPRLSLLDHLWHFNARGFSKLAGALGYEVLDAFPSGTYQGIQHPAESLASRTFILRRAQADDRRGTRSALRRKAWRARAR
ncbi:MAG TPA: class I SAM-dependent methyltransferase [Candidatus Paceibacterota bacterium]|nr:class I SAM-dependent methyltransferase [Candidatus Paceibacterota bacterium]